MFYINELYKKYVFIRNDKTTLFKLIKLLFSYYQNINNNINKDIVIFTSMTFILNTFKN